MALGSPWLPSLRLGLETGETYSQGFPLDPVEEFNRLGQRYQGPVLLIIDALCYSTTDIFSAGFQDNGIGKILGVHQHTGAGGANVWDYGRLLRRLLPDSFPELPKGADFRVSIRRTTRVGDRAGVPVEDLGIEPDELHHVARADVLRGNVDLIARAAQLLAGETVRSLTARLDRSSPQDPRLQVSARNVTRVDVYLAGRPLATHDIQGGAASIALPASLPGSGTLDLRGFEDGELVAVTQVQL